jgi:predicted acetyltransferase
MTVLLVPAERSDLPLLGNLFQFYCYDFAEILGGRVGADGCFVTPPLEPYWEDSWRHPFLVRVHAELAGFALVQRRSRITGDTETWDVAEFFVMRPYRRKGVGSQAAVDLFDRFRGRWEVRQIHANVAATHFWRAVIAHYTGGRYTELTYDDDRWRGPVQAFDNSDSPTHGPFPLPARPGRS